MEVRGGEIAGNGGIVRPSSLPFKQASEKMEFMKGVRGFTPPPFLMKTFQMVEDTETNNMISWNSEGTSLIVLDHLKFAAEGFRKIGLRQYEYENKWFQRGQEHLLMNIRRRNDEDPTIRKRRGPREQYITATRPSMEAELKIFEDHMNALKEDITRSKYHMGKLESSIATFKKNVKIMEAKSKVLIKVLAKIFSPALVEKIIQRVEEEPELEILQTMKRRRVILPQSSKTITKSTDDGACGMDQDDQEANTSMAELKKIADQKLWKKFMRDDSVSEDESEQQLLKQHSRIDMGFDDLMVSKIVNANEPNLDVEDEVVVDLWTVSFGAASRKGEKAAARRVDAAEFSASFGYFYLQGVHLIFQRWVSSTYYYWMMSKLDAANLMQL
nr:heat stress transcription factor A-7a-like [Coffea arabica]